MTNWSLDRIYNTVWDTKKELFQFFKVKRWSGKQDLNLQPLGPKPSALPS